MADRKYIAELSVQTGQSKQNIDEVQKALVASGDAGTRSASTITHALENIENASANVIRKEQEGKTITERDGKVLIQQYQLLQDAVRQYESQVGTIPAEVQSALSKANAQHDVAIGKIRTSTTVLKQQSEELKQAGVQWDGLGGAINKALGPMGKYQVGVLAAGAALKEGIELGTKFAEAIGTDFSAAESAATNLKTALGSITNALTTNGLQAALDQARASLHLLDDTVLGSGQALKGYNALVLGGVDAYKALAVGEDDLKTIGIEHAKVVEGGAAAQKLFNEVLKTSDPSEYASKLADLGKTFDGLVVKQKASTEAQRENKKAIDEAIGSLEAEIEKLKAERKAHELGIDTVTAEVRERVAYEEALRRSAEAQDLSKFMVNGLTEEMRGELAHLKELAPEIDKNKTAVDNFAEALKKDAELHRDDLNPQTREHIKELEDLIAQYKDGDILAKGRIRQLIDEIQQENQISDATKKHNEIIQTSPGHYTNLEQAANKLKITQEGGKTVISNTTEEVKKNSVEFDKTTRTMSNTKDAAERLGGKGGTLTILHQSMSDGKKIVSDYRGELDKLDTKLIDVLTHAKAVAEAMRDLNKATDEAAGTSHNSAGAAGPGEHEAHAYDNVPG